MASQALGQAANLKTNNSLHGIGLGCDNEWLKASDLDCVAMCVDESSFLSVIKSVVRGADITGLDDDQAMEALVDIWHDKKNLKKNMGDWAAKMKPELRKMVNEIGATAAEDDKFLTDAAIGKRGVVSEELACDIPVASSQSSWLSLFSAAAARKNCMSA